MSLLFACKECFIIIKNMFKKKIYVTKRTSASVFKRIAKKVKTNDN